MKRLFLTLFGIALFVAGSAYTQRRANYVAHQQQAVAANDEASVAKIRPQLKHTVAYQLVNK